MIDVWEDLSWEGARGKAGKVVSHENCPCMTHDFCFVVSTSIAYTYRLNELIEFMGCPLAYKEHAYDIAIQ